MSKPTAISVLINRRGLWLLGLALVASIGTTFLYYRHQTRYRNFVAHEDGKLYRSASLEPDALQDVIRTYGIRTVVHLSDTEEDAATQLTEEQQTVQAMDVRWLELPLPKTMNAADPELARHLELLGDPKNFPMLVHSRQGIDRTSMFVAIYDIAFRGMTARESLEAQPRFGLHEHTPDVQLFVRNFEHQHRHRELLNTAARAKTIH